MATVKDPSLNKTKYDFEEEKNWIIKSQVLGNNFNSFSPPLSSLVLKYFNYIKEYSLSQPNTDDELPTSQVYF